MVDIMVVHMRNNYVGLVGCLPLLESCFNGLIIANRAARNMAKQVSVTGK